MLGRSIPKENIHALSVSLPTWKDNVGWASGDPVVVDQLDTGYPRFFIHRTIQKLASIILEKFGSNDELCMLFPTSRAANECRAYITRRQAIREEASRVIVKVIQDSENHLAIHVAFFPPELWKLAKSFWQHTGMGISSRYAEACLSIDPHVVMVATRSDIDHDSNDINQLGAIAKSHLRKRIATLASYGDICIPTDGCVSFISVKRLPAEDDVFLFPTGMFAIWRAHQMTLSYRPGLKSVCFGFPYTDTNQILKNWGHGCYFYGNHPDLNLAALDAFLASSTSTDALSPPISALFCECPSNPLLQSTNLVRLRQLADQHGFAIIIDETIGTFVNTNLLEYADVITTSLSKLFSGQADVMGGSLVLNPNSSHYEAFRRYMMSAYVDDYYTPDAIKMEINSRDFASRVRIINANARVLCSFLRSRSLSFANEGRTIASDSVPPPFVIKEVFYPKYITPNNYNMCRRDREQNDNFGALFSLTFISQLASEAFYNALPCAKGPSLGTNFTLVCPYTILAHYNELEWAAQYGVEEGIVRVSVGMEDIETLMEWFRRSLDVAEAAV